MQMPQSPELPAVAHVAGVGDQPEGHQSMSSWRREGRVSCQSMPSSGVPFWLQLTEVPRLRE